MTNRMETWWINSSAHIVLAAIAMLEIAIPSARAIETSKIQSRAPLDKPNIIFILADDLGWADVGFQDAKFYETPNIDQLAADGMRFPHAYSGGPNCLPTRACLVSGMYTPRTNMWTPSGRSKGDPRLMKLLTPTRQPGGSDSFPSELELLPEVVSVAEVLKKAGYRTARFGKWNVGKDTQGFDVSSSDGISGPEGVRSDRITIADTLTDASLKFIDQNRDRPFFLYLAHWDVHTPIRAKQKVVDRYKKKLDARHWDREWNATYAAMIEAVDKSVGRIRSKVHELRLSRNTLIIFSSDNGGLPWVSPNFPLKGGKGSLFEGGVRVPTCMMWQDTIEAGSRTETPITSVDFLPTFAELSSTPLPTSQPVDGESLVPLLVGKRALEDRAIFWHFPLYLKGEQGNRVLPVYGTNRMVWRAVPASMIRRGPWKLIRYHEDGSERLYNVVNDPSETRDHGDENSDVRADLSAQLSAWLSRVDAAIPTMENPNFQSQP